MFDQETYEVRVDAEADLMIALEALKNEVKDLTTGFHTLEANIHHASAAIDANSAALYENNS